MSRKKKTSPKVDDPSAVERAFGILEIKETGVKHERGLRKEWKNR